MQAQREDVHEGHPVLQRQLLRRNVPGADHYHHNEHFDYDSHHLDFDEHEHDFDEHNLDVDDSYVPTGWRNLRHCQQ